MKRIVTQGLLALLFIGLCALGLWLGPKGFDDIKDMRQLARVPTTVPGAVLPGPTSVQARVANQSQLLTSRLTQTPSVYHRYRHEIEERDSDGNTRWVTQTDEYKAMDFTLEDDSGRIGVDVSENDQRPIDWDLPHSKQVTQGSHRYTEWLIRPGDELFIFALAQSRQNNVFLTFRESGHFTPVISKGNAESVRADMGSAAIGLLWLSLTAFSFALYCLTCLLKIHRVLVYLSLLTAALSVILVEYSWRMMSEDMQAGVRYYEARKAAAEQRIDSLYLQNNLQWAGWHHMGDVRDAGSMLPTLTQNQLWRIRMDLAETREQLALQLQAVPERWFLGAWGITIPDPIAGLPERDQHELQRRLAAFNQNRIDGLWTWLVPIGGLLMTLLCLFFGVRNILTKRLIESLPTSPCQGVVYGMAEVSGILQPDDQPLLQGPLTQTPCLWFDYLVEEKRGSGKDAKWVTIEHRQQQMPFFCRDDSGQIRIAPDQAEVVTRHHDSKTSGSRRYSEQRLQPDDRLYAIGYADVDDSGDALILRHHTNQDTFIISNYPEAHILLSKGRLGLGLITTAFSGLMLAALILFARQGGFAATDFLAAALLAPLMLTLVMLVLHYNDLVFLRRRCERNQANIAVALRKRYDLIPNLVASVKQYLNHEQGLLNELTTLRSGASEVNDAAGMNAYLAQEQQVNRQLLAVAEQYPDLKGNTVTTALMQHLSQLETELALMCSGYNDALETYNRRCAQFPDVILARLFGFKEIAWGEG